MNRGKISGISSEIHSIVLVFYQACNVRNMLEGVRFRLIPIEEYVDSKSVFKVIAKDRKKKDEAQGSDIHICFARILRKL